MSKIIDKISNIFTTKATVIREQKMPRVITMGDQLPNWMDVNGYGNNVAMYEAIPDLSYPINYIALNASKITFKVMKLNAAGEPKKEITSGALVDFLKRPNSYQSWQEFISDAMKKSLIFGNLPITLSKPAGYESTIGYDYWINNINGLFNLPANRTQIQFKNVGQSALFFTRDISEIVNSYIYDQSIRFEPEDTILLNDSNIKWENGEWILGDSKIDLLQKPLSNLFAAYEARNVIVTRRGALGIFSAGSDKHGYTPLDDPEKKDLQQKLELDYGLSHRKFQFIFTNKPLTYQSIAMQIKEMQLLEGHAVDRKTVWNEYNFPDDLGNGDDNPKYENRKEAYKQLYQDSILPVLNPIYHAVNELLKTKDNGFQICPDYNAIEALQPDKQAHAELSTTKTTAIMSINNNIRTGAITPEQGLNILINIWNFEKDIAESVINKMPIETINE